jgi:septal ring factor EnvC (AmiA/AmiB activator)
MGSGIRNGLGVALLMAALALPAAQPNKSRTEAELKQLRQRIERLQRQAQDDAEEKDRQTRDLRVAEQAVNKAQGELGKVRSQRSERSTARAKLEAERLQREAERQRTQSDLASQLRSSYMMGRAEPLKMALNQRNPAQFRRNLTYYGYLGRDRAQKITLITENIARIDELKQQIDAEDQELAKIEAERQQRAQDLEKARKQRERALGQLKAESRGRDEQLRRLLRQQQQMESLLAKLQKESDNVPFDPNDAFAKLRGKLSWPVAGRIEMRYGERIGGQFTSDAVEIATDRGSSVRAVHEGLVIFADWVPGRGLMIILKHGDGYLSLYGHNEQIFKEVGATVQAGDVIATAGDSGGREHPGLYFQIRRNGKAINPTGWFKSPTPPPG